MKKPEFKQLSDNFYYHASLSKKEARKVKVKKYKSDLTVHFAFPVLDDIKVIGFEKGFFKACRTYFSKKGLIKQITTLFKKHMGLGVTMTKELDIVALEYNLNSDCRWSVYHEGDNVGLMIHEEDVLPLKKY